MREVRFVIGQKVNILDLDRPGRVISIWITKVGIQYQVRYFDDATAKEVYFFEDEIRGL